MCLPRWRRGCVCVCVCVQQSVSETVGPTLPGGLVVRIRRSHRRGPGSIPGQGSFSSSSLHLHFTKLPSLLPNTDAHQQHNSTIRARPRTPTPTPGPQDPIPHRPLPASRTPSLQYCPFLSHTTSSLSAPTYQLCASPPQTRCLPWKQDYTPVCPHRKRTFPTRGPDHNHSSTHATHEASAGLHLLIACS